VSYQWYKNETVITGATLITYTVTQSGTYTVAGVNASGTGTPSPDHVVTITSCGDESIEGAWSGWAYAAFDEEEVEWDEVIVQAGEGIFHLTNFLDWGDDLLYVLREDTDGYYVQNESSIGVHPEYGVVRQVMAGWDPIQDKKYVFTGEVYLEMELDGNTLKLEEEDTYDVGGTPTVLKHAIASMVTIDDLNYFLDFGVGVTYTKDGAKKSSSTTKKTKKSNRKQQVLQVGKEIETLKR
ncbi:MAG: hypothetical protein LBH91_00380, partial [Prevotellaceae bacterium]|nr:hypothetical protein [Prevotellaceae bacterium]